MFERILLLSCPQFQYHMKLKVCCGPVFIVKFTNVSNDVSEEDIIFLRNVFNFYHSNLV
jgi:hypothetical protein